MSRGFHAFFRQYYNLRGLLRRTDPGLTRLRGLPDYPLRHGDGLDDSFRHVPRTPPWSALGFVALVPPSAAGPVPHEPGRRAAPSGRPGPRGATTRLDDVSARDFLDAIRFPEAAQHLAFEVFSRSFFADPRELSAAEIVLMFHIYFLGSAKGSCSTYPSNPSPPPCGTPSRRYLRGHGADLRAGTPVEASRPRPTAVSSSPPARRNNATTPSSWPWTRPACAPSSGAPPAGRRRVARADRRPCAAAPPFLVSRLWLDRPVAADRPGFLGTSGYGTLDNVSVLDRWEGEAARWAARTGGSVVELHAYALPGRRPTTSNRSICWSSCTTCIPRHASATCSTNGTSGGPTVRCSRSASTTAAPRYAPATPAGGGRGPGTHRPPGRPHGARGHQRVPRRQRAARAVGGGWPDAVDRARPWPRPAAAPPRATRMSPWVPGQSAARPRSVLVRLIDVRHRGSR